MNQMNSIEAAIARRQFNETLEKTFARRRGQTERLILSRVAFRGESLRIAAPGAGVRDEMPTAMRAFKEQGGDMIIFNKELRDALEAEQNLPHK